MSDRTFYSLTIGVCLAALVFGGVLGVLVTR